MSLQIFIGGWSNNKSVIRKNRTKPDVAEAETPEILSGDEYRGFWIRWELVLVYLIRESLSRGRAVSIRVDYEVQHTRTQRDLELLT